MTMRTISRIFGLVGAAVVLAGGQVAAQSAAEFYKGKTVKFIVGVGVGGGFDAYARMLAPHIGRALEATVVVENMPGAGGLIALNQMAAATPDGLRFKILNGTPSLLAQILEQANVKYDLTTMPHLAGVAAEPWGIIAGAQSGITSAQDLVKPGRKIRWGGTGPTGGPSDGASLTCQALSVDCRVVLGYRGSAEIALAMQRGELDALYVTDASLAQYQKAQQGTVVAMASRKRSAVLPQVPTLYEALKLTKEQEWWLDFRAELNGYGRVLLTMPGIPADRLAHLRAAIAKVLTDPAVIAEGAKTQRFIQYRDAATMQAIATGLVKQLSGERKAQVREAVLKKFIN
jgi:tripartite-type tricarboxylate transporter receptor subunit TctC